MTDDDAPAEAGRTGAFGPDGLEAESRGADDDHDRPAAAVDEELADETGENIFGGPLNRGPIMAGRPEAENVLFVLVGILTGVLVMMRLVGAI